MKEYNYNKDEVIIETRYNELGEDYKVYYENKKYLFGLFSIRGDKIQNGIVLIISHETYYKKTIVQNGWRIKDEIWIDNKKKKVTRHFDEKISKKKKTITNKLIKDDETHKKKTQVRLINKDLYNGWDQSSRDILSRLPEKLRKETIHHLNKHRDKQSFKGKYERSKWIPHNLLEFKSENGLYYFKNKIFNGFVIRDTFENGKPRNIIEYKNGIEGGVLKLFYENGYLWVDGFEFEGLPDGLTKMYKENGLLNNEITFDNGNPIKSKWYYDNGKVKREEDEKGLKKCWDENGNEIECED